MSAPRVAVVVPVHNKVALTLRFLESFRRVTYPHHTVVVVDDGSTDGTAQALARRFPEVVRLPGDGRLWWAGATNRGVRYALAQGFAYVLTINNDALVSPDFLARLVRTAQAQPRSLVGSRINFLAEPRTVWSVGGQALWSKGVVLQLGDWGRPEEQVLAGRANPCPVDVLTGCGTLVPADCYRAVGLYDARWCPQYHADSEFVLRAARHGYRALVDLDAVVFNDAANTCASKNPLARRSPWFWRPILAIHMRYCPSRYLLGSLWSQYVPVYQASMRRFLERRVRPWLRRLLGRAA
jgi:GT2 family glycosyltransferase